MLATAFRAVRGRPPTGVGHYLRDLVYGANDGTITTFAIVAGVSGANLAARVAIILGLANLLADGVSMATSNYLSTKSDLEQRGLSVEEEKPWRHGAATFAAFVVAGILPLLSYFIAPPLGVDMFPMAVGLAAFALVAVGVLRAPFVGRKASWSALEMLAIGAAAGTVAFLLGLVGDRVL